MAADTRVPKIHAYGPAEAQHVAVSWPSQQAAPRGIVALIHGGYWRAHLFASLMDPLAASLRENGWVTANIEYRRGSTGPWPAPLNDVRVALEMLSAFGEKHEIGGPLLTVGHSVGGQLALLNAKLTDGVVALAPVTDVATTYREKLGDDAAAEYFGASPEQAPELYREASPLYQSLGTTPALLLHGINDDRVPVAHSRAFLAAGRSQGSAVELLEYQALGHLEAIDPSAGHWPDALSWMAEVPEATPRESNSASA